MKYIKLFEDSMESEPEPDRYWKVKLSSPEYEISIDKIGMKGSERKKFLNKLVLFKGLYPDSKYFYIAETEYYSEPTYSYSQYPFSHVTFEGVIKITQEELDEWNMEHDAEKYNL